jgi:hypothetical protein
MRGAANYESRIARNKIALDYAKMNTKKIYIDYGNLSTAERTLTKLFPFYTWVRQNLANQINGIIHLGNTYRLIPKVEKFIKDDEGFDYTLMEDWQKNLGIIPVGKDPEGKWRLLFPNIPLADINKIPLKFSDAGPEFAPEELRDSILSSAHPLIKTVTELLYHKNSFKRREMLSHVKAPAVVQVFARTPATIEMLDGLLRKAGFKNGARINKEGKYVEMDEGMVQILNNNLPILRTIERWAGGVGKLVPGIEAALRTGKKETYEDIQDTLNIIAYFTGNKQYTFDEEYYKNKRADAILKEAEAKRREDRKSLPGYAKRSAQAAKSRDKRKKRIGL